MELCYWKSKGRAESIRYILAFLEEQYQETNPISVEEHSKLLEDLKFPATNLPYLIDGNIHLCENVEIFKYLARKNKKEYLLGKNERDSTVHETLLTNLWSVKESLFDIIISDDPMYIFSCKIPIIMEKFNQMSLHLVKNNKASQSINSFKSTNSRKYTNLSNNQDQSAFVLEPKLFSVKNTYKFFDDSKLNIVTENTPMNNFLIGYLTIADFELSYVFDFAKTLASTLNQHQTFDGFSQIQEHQNNIYSIPQIRQYLKNDQRAKNPYFVSHLSKIKF